MFMGDGSGDRSERRSLWKVAARVPWPALLACCLYLPGIVLWAVYSLRCKANTFLFLTTVAPVAQETVDAVTNTVNTTLFTLAAGGTFIFALLLVLAIARSIQRAGVAPNNCCPCARTTPSSYYLYRVFNMGFNIIVFFVNLAIMFLMMGAFLWLVVAYAANLSIKGGVKAAADAGVDPVEQVLQANRTYSTVVSDYEKQLQQTPACVVNSTWFKDLNGSISKILEPIPFITNKTLNGTDGAAAVNTLLCPQTCLNLGSFATLFKLQQNCICSSEQLAALQQYSAMVSADAGVCLASVMLIYLACSTLHAYLIGQYVHAGYDYRAAKQRYAELIKQRRRQHALSMGSSSNNSRQHPKGGGPRASVPAGPMHGGPGYSNGMVGGGGAYAGADDVEAGLARGSKAFGVDQSSSSESGKAVPVAAAPAVVVLGGNEIHLSAVTAGAAAGLHGSLARYSRQSSGSSAAAAGWPAAHHGAGHGAAKASPLSRSSPVATSGGLGHEPIAAASSGSLVAVASLRAWERGHSQQHHSSAAPADGAVAGHHHQQPLQRGSLDAGPATGPAGHAVHSRTGSKSSAGSIRELLLGAVPLDHTSSYHHHQQLHHHHQQLTGAGSGTSVAAAAAPAPAPTTANSSPDSATRQSSGDSASSGAAVTQQNINHKPSSSGGSYESMIYHSPRNSEAGSSSSPSLAAASALLDLTPQGITKMQQRRQHHASHPASSGAWAHGQGTDTVQEGPSELSPVVDREPSSLTVSAEPSPAAAAAVVASSPSPSSGADANIYETLGSSNGDTPSSLSSSGRKSRHSHRRLPAFDLSNSPHQFMTVEGLEQQQKLQRELSSRPSSPEVAAGAVPAAAAADMAEYAAAAGPADTVPAATATSVEAAEHLSSVPVQAAKDWPDMAAGAHGGVDTVPAANAASAAEAVVMQPADAASAGQQRAPLSVRRHITMPAHLQLPARDNSPVMMEQQQQEQQQPEQPAAQAQQWLQQYRAPFVSPLLPPPEQQRLLLQRQQQQLALLLAQEEEQQWQQPSGPQHQRHWSTPTAVAVAAVTARSGSSSPAANVYGLQHQHTSSATEPSGAYRGRGLGFSTSVPGQQAGFSYPQRLGATGFRDGVPVEPSSVYNSPLPSPLSVATPATTPSAAGGYGNLMPGHAGSSSSSAAGPSVPSLFGAGSISTNSSFSASQLAYPASSMMSSYNGGMTPMGVSTASTPRSIPGSNSSMGSPAAGPLPLSSAGSSGFPGVPPTIPEVGNSGYSVEGGSGVPGQQQGGVSYGGADVGTGSPLERRRSGYRSSMRKGLMAYDQYKYRQRYQQEVSSPLDPRTELSRRYRNRIPAI